MNKTSNNLLTQAQFNTIAEALMASQEQSSEPEMEDVKGRFYWLGCMEQHGHTAFKVAKACRFLNPELDLSVILSREDK